MARNTWKMFPKTKPQKAGRYIVTVSHKCGSTDFRRVYLDMLWSEEYGLWNVSEDPETAIDDVIAWKEMPTIAPFTGAVPEGMGVRVCVD